MASLTAAAIVSALGLGYSVKKLYGYIRSPTDASTDPADPADAPEDSDAPPPPIPKREVVHVKNWARVADQLRARAKKADAKAKQQAEGKFEDAESDTDSDV